MLAKTKMKRERRCKSGHSLVLARSRDRTLEGKDRRATGLADPMMSLKQAAKWLMPPLLLLPFRPGHRITPDGPPRWHRGDFPDWQSAVSAARGYQAGNILDIQRRAMRKVRDGQAVYERD